MVKNRILICINESFSKFQNTHKIFYEKHHNGGGVEGKTKINGQVLVLIDVCFHLFHGRPFNYNLLYRYLTATIVHHYVKWECVCYLNLQSSSYLD